MSKLLYNTSGAHNKYEDTISNSILIKIYFSVHLHDRLRVLNFKSIFLFFS